MRIWWHVTVANAQRILIYSSDTDVYNIGVAVANKLPQKDIIVQINVVHAREHKHVHIQNLVKVLESDLDIASIPQDNLSTIFHMLYVVSGCDYISYFSGFGKGTFEHSLSTCRVYFRQTVW